MSLPGAVSAIELEGREKENDDERALFSIRINIDDVAYSCSASTVWLIVAKHNFDETHTSHCLRRKNNSIESASFVHPLPMLHTEAFKFIHKPLIATHFACENVKRIFRESSQ